MNGWLLASQHGRRVRKEKGHDENEVGGGVAISATSPQKERRELSRVGSSLRKRGVNGEAG